ncbi:peptidase U32 family protein [Glaciecola sp. 2405UD65-10]|uniref:peptidase U32 family protein n=1 Tax=Glaciecola sp. 2405UD65-10 TaxID=3397244 RepID=UPI003B5B96BB
MTQKIELLAPGGDVNAIKAAIIAGADAVYCGLDNFNARNRASNINFEELVGVIRLAHHYECQIFLTLNIVILEREFKSLARLLSRLQNTALDGVIVQDMGLLYVLKTFFPRLDIHASTQMTTHNIGQIPFLKKLGVSRVNLSRELNLREISAMAATGHEHDVLCEVFVHGSLCVAFSGLCYSTSASAGNSGNRGRCSQACREEYETTSSGNNFPLNIKDNSAFFDLPALIEAGVYSFKVEGRIKSASYVHTVTDSFRKQIDGYLQTGELTQSAERLYKVFNRDFSNAFLRGDLNQSMFSENPRDNSKKFALASSDAISVVQIQTVEENFDQEKSQLAASVSEKIEHISIDKPELHLAFSGQAGSPLQLSVSVTEQAKFESAVLAKKLSDKMFSLASSEVLVENQKTPLNQMQINKRFKNLDNAEFNLLDIDTHGLEANLGISHRSLSALKNELISVLHNGQEYLPEVILPPLENHKKPAPKDALMRANLSILICDEADADLVNEANTSVYFKLPDAYKRGCTKYIDFLTSNPRLIPWFPAVLIGKDYDVAVNILSRVMPPLIVTNNTGIAQLAYSLGIKWIAGPFLNTTNSYSLLAMQESFDCSGAFISNEINRMQIKHIARPANFSMHYSVYHPILLMVSRQCFFQQSVGCEKPRIDNGCMLSCDKSTSITNVKGQSFAIDKQKAGYPSIYNQDQFVNTDIIDDLADMFDDFMIDLTNIGMGSKERPNKQKLIQAFNEILMRKELEHDSLNVRAKEQLNRLVKESTSEQYYNGL